MATMASALAATAAVAQTAAFDVNGAPAAALHQPYTLGYTFSTSQAFSVSALGVLDDGLDGLSEAHDVGLWSGDGALLASTTVGAGAAGTLIGKFRYAPVTSVSLAPGAYRIGALYISGADSPTFLSGASTTSINGFTYLAPQVAGGATLNDPTSRAVDPNLGAYFGPNLLVTGLAAVPEPATWGLMILGFGTIGHLLRRAVRRSEEKFNAKIRRIAEGLEP